MERRAYWFSLSPGTLPSSPAVGAAVSIASLHGLASADLDFAVNGAEIILVRLLIPRPHQEAHFEIDPQPELELFTCRAAQARQETKLDFQLDQE